MRARAARELAMQDIAPELRGINGQPATNQLGTSGSGQPAPSVQLKRVPRACMYDASDAFKSLVLIPITTRRSDQSGLRDALAEVQAELNEFRTRLATQEANAQPVSQSASRKRKRMDNGRICTGSKPEGEWNDAERALKSLLAERERGWSDGGYLVVLELAHRTALTNADAAALAPSGPLGPGHLSTSKPPRLDISSPARPPRTSSLRWPASTSSPWQMLWLEYTCLSVSDTIATYTQLVGTGTTHSDMFSLLY
ncbi:hypothetical protein BOTBODRAFT_49617 [Botryobasidium botryosum FD-172 SS1]|uniref:Uncharacterized protein n=1 Tax=Botryobasidium botryosum (strain FD-172 SS1) TaxID=930990 RepID=A0A067M282_BOTB1|nr:hypothetical protein BOTBODRAFT_49617 [Botryobasidium botryosum FD-172 SS1]